MDKINEQELLNLIIRSFEDHLSPQILRRAIEYAKDEADLIGDDIPTPEAATAVLTKTQGFIGGYCDFVDGIPRLLRDIVTFSTKQARDAFDLVRSDYGEDYSFTAFAGASRHVSIMEKSYDANLQNIDLGSAVRHATLGYLEGYLQAELDESDRKFIRNMSLNLPDRFYAEKLDAVFCEVEAVPGYREQIRDQVFEGVKDVFNMYLRPKSGHATGIGIEIGSFVTLYVLGFVKGADKKHDAENGMRTFAQIMKDQPPMGKVAMQEIVAWALQRGLTRASGERAARAIDSFTMLAMPMDKGQLIPHDVMDTVMGMGYVDGLHYLLGSRIEAKEDMIAFDLGVIETEN